MNEELKNSVPENAENCPQESNTAEPSAVESTPSATAAPNKNIIKCKTCGTEIAKSAKACPSCGAKNKKPIYKRVWFWLIVIVVLLGIIGSLSDNDSDDSAATTAANSTAANTNTATEDSEESSASTEASTPQSWSKDFYVDSFDEPTDEWYISRTFSGTFSNSATSNSRLTGKILIDEENISIFLYEYNSHQVKNIYSRSEKYDISVRLDDGTTKEFTGYIYSEGDRIYIDDSDVEALRTLLINGGEMKFYICESDNSVTNYLFEISSDNLKDIIV